MVKTDPVDFLTAMFKEASSMASIAKIEAYLDEKKDLSPFPVQPLYMAVKKLKGNQIAEVLPQLSSEQRQYFLDLDLWKRDELDVDQFLIWLESYSKCDREAVRSEFVKSESFIVFLKGKFNVWTFDAEDPLYPDHDYYFLTEDNLLLFEYDEHFSYVQEVKDLISHLYSELGVEKAYSFLFKMISDGMMTLMEEEYQLKKERLRDIGIVDYYDALEIDNPFSSIEIMDHYIKNKTPTTGRIDPELSNQTLNRQALVPYHEHMGMFQKEIEKVSDGTRLRYLEFNFIRLVNGGITLNGGLKEGAVVMSRAGVKTRSLLFLGLDYIKSVSSKKGDISLDEKQSILDYFDFSELYRIGNTLIRELHKIVKKALQETNFHNNEEGFLGSFWIGFLDDIFDTPVKLTEGPEKLSCEVTDVEKFYQLKSLVDTFKELVPFIQGFYASFNKLRNDGRLSNSYYLNYAVDQIDFEAIIISTIATYGLGLLGKGEKLGLTLEEYKSFCEMALDEGGKVYESGKFRDLLASFIKEYGLAHVPHLLEHLIFLLKSQMEGYDYKSLSYDDFRHVGGPIILDGH